MLRAFVRAVWTICKKELRVWLRQPANVAITVLPALSLLFIDARSAGAVGRSPVALVTLGQVEAQGRSPVLHNKGDPFMYAKRFEQRIQKAPVLDESL